MDERENLFKEYINDIVDKYRDHEVFQIIRKDYRFGSKLEEQLYNILASKLFTISEQALVSYYEKIKHQEKDWCKEDIYMEYPLLKELEDKKMCYELNALQKIVSGLVKYYQNIVSEFKMTGNPCITNIDTMMGDCHKDKVVARIDFDNGRSLMYKTRASVGERLISGLDKILKIDFAIPKTINYGDFIIQEFVEKKQEFQNEKQVCDFYYNFGKMSVVFTCLGATDLHSENIIATPQGPKFIDLETVISVIPTDRWFDFSYLRNTLLFPGSIDKKIYGDLDICGLSGGENDGNIPILKNAGKVNPLNYQKYILLGYDDTVKIILSNKEAVIECINQNLTGKIRKVVRNTAFYARFLNYSYAPAYLSSKEKRDAFFDLLSKHSKLDQSIIEHEKKELKEMFIPIFENDLDKEEANFEKEELLERMKRLGKSFFENERNVLLLSLAINDKGIEPEKKCVTRVDYECQKFIDYAQRGDKLYYITLDKAISNKLLDYKNDLFTFGGALITLALKDFDEGEKKYLGVIKKTLQSNLITGNDVSGILGSESRQNLIWILNKIYKDIELEELLEDGNEEITLDENAVYDFSGVGSLFLFRYLRNLMSNTDKKLNIPDEWLEIYQLKQKQRRPLTGLFHGFAGDLIVNTIIQTRDNAENQKVDFLELLNAEDTYYLEEIQNWNDIRTENVHDMVAVSYGAPGILLSRAFMKNAFKYMNQSEKEIVQRDIKRAVNKILLTKREDYYDDTLINGYAGALLSLYIAQKYVSDLFSEKKRMEMKSFLLEGRTELEISNWRCQGIKEAYVPNFMNGRMGITFLLILLRRI